MRRAPTQRQSVREPPPGARRDKGHLLGSPGFFHVRVASSRFSYRYTITRDAVLTLLPLQAGCRDLAWRWRSATAQQCWSNILWIDFATIQWQDAKHPYTRSQDDCAAKPEQRPLASSTIETEVNKRTPRIEVNLLQGVTSGPATYAVMTVYFVQGVLGLAARTYFMKDELGLGAAEASAVWYHCIPMVIKPLYGFLTDGLPILGYRRKPYLIIAGVLGSAAWASLATVVTTPTRSVSLHRRLAWCRRERRCC